MLTETPMNPISTNCLTGSSRPVEILYMYSCSATAFLRPATQAFVSFLVSPILPEWPASRKTKLQQNYLSSFSALSALRDTRVFAKFALRQEVNSADFPCTDWLSYQRTQLKTFVGGVCSRSRIFFLALFSRISFFARSRTLKRVLTQREFVQLPSHSDSS